MLGTKSNQLVKCLGWPCSSFWCPANGHAECDICSMIDAASRLDVVAFLFGAAFFFAAALAASVRKFSLFVVMSFKLNWPLTDIENLRSTTSKPSNFLNVPLTRTSTRLVFDDFGRCTLPPRFPTCPNVARRHLAVKLRVSGVFRGIAQCIRRE